MSEVQPKPNGMIGRIFQFVQAVIIACVLPWAVWVTSQIFAVRSSVNQLEQWKITREKVVIPTMTDVELAKSKVKEELMASISLKLDTITLKLADIDLKLTRHEAQTSKGKE